MASTLLWSDEFDGLANTPVDSTKWNHETGAGGWGNNELETYTSDSTNSSYDGNSNLKIAVYKNSSGSYSSARLNSKFSTTYGHIEARISLPSGQGYWPAFWMLGTNINSVGWPACGEVDILEAINTCNTCYQTIHGADTSGNHWQLDTPSTPIAPGFHTYTLDWTTTALIFSVDGVTRSATLKSNLKSGQVWSYDKPFYILLNVAVGGDWPGNPSSSTSFPQSMLVDYVRWYSTASTPITPPPSTNTSVTLPMLQPGANGASVRSIQALLTQRGVPTSVSGTWDTVTTTNLQKFQQLRGIPITSICDATTWRRLITG
jgi:beta-glucanase (GH16 family)